MSDFARNAVVRIDGVDASGVRRQLGSGFMIAPDRCVTAAHVVVEHRRPPNALRVFVPSAGEGSEAEDLSASVHWMDFDSRDPRTRDVAVLRLPSPVPEGRWLNAVDWSPSLVPRSLVSVRGFPLAIDRSGRPTPDVPLSEAFDVDGSVGLQARSSLRVERVFGRPTGVAWQGLSGSGVVVNGRWTGVVTDAFSIEATWIEAVPMPLLLADPSFCAAVRVARPSGAAAWAEGRIGDREGVVKLVARCVDVLSRCPRAQKLLRAVIPSAGEGRSEGPADLVRDIICGCSPTRLHRAFSELRRSLASLSGESAVRAALDELYLLLVPLVSMPGLLGVQRAGVAPISEGTEVFVVDSDCATIADRLFSRYLGRPAAEDLHELFDDDVSAFVGRRANAVEALRRLLLFEGGMDEELPISVLYLELGEMLGVPRSDWPSGSGGVADELRREALRRLNADLRSDRRSADSRAPYFLVRLPTPSHPSRALVVRMVARLAALIPELPVLALEPPPSSEGRVRTDSAGQTP